MYWILTSDRKVTAWSFGRGLIVSNMAIAKYQTLLANIIGHVKPGTKISDSILAHLNITKSDIGKLYGSDQWIDEIIATSYWTQPLNNS